MVFLLVQLVKRVLRRIFKKEFIISAMFRVYVLLRVSGQANLDISAADSGNILKAPEAPFQVIQCINYSEYTLQFVYYNIRVAL